MHLKLLIAIFGAKWIVKPCQIYGNILAIIHDVSCPTEYQVQGNALMKPSVDTRLHVVMFPWESEKRAFLLVSLIPSLDIQYRFILAYYPTLHITICYEWTNSRSNCDIEALVYSYKQYSNTRAEYVTHFSMEICQGIHMD